jgi:hypothetical protein
MPIISVPESDTSRRDPRLVMNSPLLFDTDTLTGTVASKDLFFDHISDGSQSLNAPAIIGNFTSSRYSHTSYSVFSDIRGIVYVRLNFSFVVNGSSELMTHTFYLKARDPRWPLAFSMGSHPRLGERSAVLRLPAPDDSEVFRLIHQHILSHRNSR